MRRISGMIRKAREWLISPAQFAWVVTALSFLLAVSVSLFPSTIRGSTRSAFEAFFKLEARQVEWSVLFFWLLVLVLLVLLHLRFRQERSEALEQARSIRQAIYRAPNPRVFVEYSNLFENAYSAEMQLREGVEGSDSADVVGKASQTVRQLLSACCDLVGHFAPPQSQLGANVMLVQTREEGSYSTELVQRLKFFDTDRQRIESLRGLLYIPKDLVFPHAEDEGDLHIPLIALPVPQEPFDKTEKALALPGAPFALLTGTQTSFDDTRLLADQWCQDFDAQTRDQVRHYFSSTGDGKGVRSFVSFRIGTAGDPVGVLNVDCSEPGILGSDEYHETLFALMKPLLALLDHPVAEYARRAFAEGVLFSLAPHEKGARDSESVANETLPEPPDRS